MLLLYMPSLLTSSPFSLFYYSTSRDLHSRCDSSSSQFSLCFWLSKQITYPEYYRARVSSPKSKKNKKKKKKEKKKSVAEVVRMRLDGVDEDLQKLLDLDLDQAPARRIVRRAFKEIQLSIDHCLFKAPNNGVKMKEEYEENSRGLMIFTKCWLPEISPIKATICFCHGYGDTCTFFVEGIAKKLASAGYGVFAMDYPGFGLSDGLHGYIPSLDRLVDDVAEHFSKVKEDPEYKHLPSFLFGQSMGGAVALKVHLKQPHAWSGAILVAPMCKIADDMVPSWLVTQILIVMAKILPKRKLVPQNDFSEMAFRDLKKRKMTSFNVIAYKDKPRLGSALELLRTTQVIERQLGEISLPLLILHGEADIVTDPSVSKALYEKAKSLDKKLILYKDAYHGLLEGGLVIWRSGSVMVVYRGSNYAWPSSKSLSQDKQRTSPTILHDGDTLFVPDVSPPENLVAEIGRRSITPSEEKAKASNTNPAHVESLTEEEAEFNSLLDGLGPRFVDWWGTGLLPVDADLLPPHIPGYKTPFRLLPTGMRSSLTNAELTNLRKLARSLPCHFALGRNRNHHGLAAAIVRLWEKSIVAKIAIKRGIQNTNNKLMAEELKKLTGGTLLLRNKYYIVIYRGKDFLPTSVAAVLAERVELTKDIQDVEEKARIAPVHPTCVNAATTERQESAEDNTNFEGKAHCGAVEATDRGEVEGLALAGTLAESLEAQARWGREISDHDREKMKEEAARAKTAKMVNRIAHKLAVAQAKKLKAERLLGKIEASMVPAGPSDDQETITDEERFMFRRVGLRMKPYLHLGVRGVFDGIIENMHLHWKYRELVKLISKQKTLSFVEDTARLLEYESGGILVAIERVPKGYALIFYRGKNYQRPISIRPKNLLTKAKALKRSVAMQRHEGLSQHISELESTIEKTRSELGVSKYVEGESTWKSDEEIRFGNPQFPLCEDEGSFLDSDSDEGNDDDWE